MRKREEGQMRSSRAKRSVSIFISFASKGIPFEAGTSLPADGRTGLNGSGIRARAVCLWSPCPQP